VKRAGGASLRPAPGAILTVLGDWLNAPQRIERLALLRVFVPASVLGFLSSRIIHADYWLGSRGFRVPDLGGDWRQPLYIPALPDWAAWAIGGAMILSGLCLVVGLAARPAALVFAILVAYGTLADRLEAFTVTKLAPVLTLALFFSPCGARYGVDAWLAARRDPSVPRVTHVLGGSIRFFQCFLVTMYSASGIAKARGDWLSKQVLWTHLHDAYQTQASWLLMRALPTWSWWLFQGLVLVFECGAPFWFALPWTRTPALVVGIGMHAMIGLMFGPVVWFALLMGSMLFASFVPDAPLLRIRRMLGMRD